MAVSFESQSVVCAQGQRVVDAVEAGVALAPDEFGGVQRGNDEEEQRGGAFDRLQHQIGHGPDIAAGNAAGEVAVVDRERNQQSDDAPERDLAR